MHQGKPSFEKVTAGLSSKSEKIRKLALAGYLRTEIADLLGIRYQHVRKVLSDAGIALGLQREVEFAREPVEVVVDEDEPSAPSTSWEVLLRAGFLFLGEWMPDGDGSFRLDAKAPPDAGVYAFVVDDVVKYVGLTQRGLRGRLDAYRRGYARQRTNARVKQLINAALADRRRVKVLVATPEAMEWKGLPVSTAAGLEAGLIAMIRPEWNILGAT
jgi:hypothetical protein